MEQMKASGMGGLGGEDEADPVPEGDSSDDDGPPPLEQAQ